MAEIIEDGAGSGYKAKVNANKRLYTNSVVVTENEQANKTGRAYNINTGKITLTNANDTPVLYLKNNETEDLHVTALAFGLGASTGGSGEVYITVIRNPTAGTTIDNANNVAINSNRNYGSSLTLSDSLAYKGATSETMTDGDDHILIQAALSSRVFATIDEVIPKGKSLGIKIDPPAGNTSMVVYAALICHLEDASA